MSNLIFNFQEMSSKDKTSKAVQKSFKKAGADVVQVDVSTTAKRTSGISYRELSLTFADSQTVTLRIKQSGDIYQVVLNGKVKPIAKHDDHEAAIVEIVKAMDAGRTAYQKKLAKAAIKLPKSIKTTVPNKEKLLTEKRDALKDAVAEAEKVLAELKPGKFKGVALDSANDDDLTPFDRDAHQAATSPRNRTKMPKIEDLIAGNYHKGAMQIGGLNISIENPAGSMRKGIGENGQEWQVKMQHHYGYFDGSMGVDGDEVDVFVKNHLLAAPSHAYVIYQVNKDGDFDEHKVVVGAESEQEAKEIYLSNYKPGWDGLGSIEKMSFSGLKDWLSAEMAA